MRERVQIPFGSGIDRATGRMLVRPGGMRDLRNVYLYEGRIIVRRGSVEIAEFTDEGGTALSHIIGGTLQRTERVGIVLGYQEAGIYAGRVYAFRTGPTGEDPVRLAVGEDARAYLWELNPEFGRPRVIFADSYGKVFIAHDEEIFAQRGETYYYDSTLGTLVLLTADFVAGEGVRFRGVARHLNYLLGWGGDESRPEILRVSLAGEPTQFDDNDYWIIGQRGEAILNVIKGVVLKEDTELWRLVGSRARDFGAVELDLRYGVVSAQLAMEHAGGVIFWSPDGPRWTDGSSPSIDLAIPLDLLGFEPGDLAAAGDADYGFVCTLPSRRILMFVFGRRGYSLSFANPEHPKWSYVEFPWELDSAFLLYSEAQIAAPIGYALWLDPAETSDFWITARVEHVGARGDELLEVWLKPASTGVWVLHTSVPVKASQAIQTFPLTDLNQNEAYDVALRYRAGGLYTVGYEGATPDDWPAPNAGSFGSFSTLFELRQLDVPVWSRIDAMNEKIALTWSGGPLTHETRIEKAPDVAGAPGAWVEVTDGGGTPDVAAGLTTYDYDADADGETYLWFRVRTVNAGVPAPVASNTKRIWVGPPAPLGITGLSGLGVGYPPKLGYQFNFIADEDNIPVEDPDSVILAVYFGASIDANYLVEQRLVNGGAWEGPYDTGPLVADGNVKSALNAISAPFGNYGFGETYGARVRTKLTQFGVDDFSDYTPPGQLSL